MDFHQASIPISLPNEDIIFYEVLNRTDPECLFICKTGNIYLLNLNNGELEALTPNPTVTTFYKIVVHSYGNYIVMVDDKGTSGVVMHIKNPQYLKLLHRGNYQVKYCSYPIGFYTLNKRTYLIHGTDWNRLDITCLNNDDLMTDREIKFEGKVNYFDYFHGTLAVAPDEKKFVSKGWHWSPYDRVTLYEVEKFIETYELSYNYLDFPYTSGYNWDRPLCWINNNTIALGYNKQEEYDEEEFDSEIIIVDTKTNEIKQEITFKGFDINDDGEVSGNFYYDKMFDFFIAFNNSTGLLITDSDGEIIMQDENFEMEAYNQKHRLFYHLNEASSQLDILKLPG